MIHVFIADDQLLVRQGIRALLDIDGGIEVVGEASDGVETIERIASRDVDVLLLDVRMPHKGGITKTAVVSMPRPFCKSLRAPCNASCRSFCVISSTLAT